MGLRAAKVGQQLTTHRNLTLIRPNKTTQQQDRTTISFQVAAACLSSPCFHCRKPDLQRASIVSTSPIVRAPALSVLLT
ncbi:hypothetical protein VTJ04DRAFT_1539 [Mycothermus thermophilus]|uniref:uncharacterized protein n=1 Tax=Humicola insolens TaxID=85995 RepID=UPI0037428C70